LAILYQFVVTFSMLYALSEQVTLMRTRSGHPSRARLLKISAD